jgi:hypothetical protein
LFASFSAPALCFSCDTFENRPFSAACESLILDRGPGTLDRLVVLDASDGSEAGAVEAEAETEFFFAGVDLRAGAESDFFCFAGVDLRAGAETDFFFAGVDLRAGAGTDFFFAGVGLRAGAFAGFF